MNEKLTCVTGFLCRLNLQQGVEFLRDLKFQFTNLWQLIVAKSITKSRDLQNKYKKRNILKFNKF